MKRTGVDDEDIKVAQRNLQRLCKHNGTLAYEDTMPMLYIAMKNLNGARFRINVNALHGWADRFSKETTRRRMFYVVEESRVPVLTPQAR